MSLWRSYNLIYINKTNYISLSDREARPKENPGENKEKSRHGKHIQFMLIASVEFHGRYQMKLFKGTYIRLLEDESMKI